MNIPTYKRDFRLDGHTCTLHKYKYNTQTYAFPYNFPIYSPLSSMHTYRHVPYILYTYIYAIENFPQYRTHIAKKEKKIEKQRALHDSLKCYSILLYARDCKSVIYIRKCRTPNVLVYPSCFCIVAAVYKVLEYNPNQRRYHTKPMA